MEMSNDKFYLYILLVSAACITFAITLVLALRKFSKKSFKIRSEFASILFLVALLLMARTERELTLVILLKIIIFDLIIVSPVWLFILYGNTDHCLKKYLSQNGFTLAQFFSDLYFGDGFTHFQS